MIEEIIIQVISFKYVVVELTVNQDIIDEVRNQTNKAVVRISGCFRDII